MFHMCGDGSHGRVEADGRAVATKPPLVALSPCRRVAGDSDGGVSPCGQLALKSNVGTAVGKASLPTPFTCSLLSTKHPHLAPRPSLARPRLCLQLRPRLPRRRLLARDRLPRPASTFPLPKQRVLTPHSTLAHDDAHGIPRPPWPAPGITISL